MTSAFPHPPCQSLLLRWMKTLLCGSSWPWLRALPGTKRSCTTVWDMHGACVISKSQNTWLKLTISFVIACLGKIHRMAIKHKGYHANSFSQLITMNCWGQFMIATFCSKSKKISSVETRWNGVKTRWNGVKKKQQIWEWSSSIIWCLKSVRIHDELDGWEKFSQTTPNHWGGPKKRQLETNIDKQSLMCLEKIFIMICCFAKHLVVWDHVYY